MKKPCRFKRCKGVTHRGPCPVRQRIGSKGGSVKTPTLSAAQINQRKQASKAPRTPSLSRNAKTTATNLKRIASRVANNLCTFCGLSHTDSMCDAASIAGSISRGTIAIINRIGTTNRAKLLKAKADDLKRRAALNIRPLLNLDAIPSTYFFDCIKCHTTNTTPFMAVAFADDVGFGLCKPCDESIVDSVLREG